MSWFHPAEVTCDVGLGFVMFGYKIMGLITSVVTPFLLKNPKL